MHTPKPELVRKPRIDLFTHLFLSSCFLNAKLGYEPTKKEVGGLRLQGVLKAESFYL
jgi:hypothetical protein